MKKSKQPGKLTAIFSAPLLCAVGVGVFLFDAVGCVTETCKEKTPLIEMQVKFKNIDLNRAALLEIETVVETDAPAGELLAAYRLPKIALFPFPEEARDGKITYLFNPGNYVMTAGRQGLLNTYKVEFVLRVFDDQNVLIGRGAWSQEMTPNACHMYSMTVSVGALPLCEEASTGEPCPTAGTTPSVCRPSQSGQSDHECRSSECGDGFVDIRYGELCDTQQSGTSITCSETCVTEPLVYTPPFYDSGTDEAFLGHVYFETTEDHDLRLNTAIAGFDGMDYPQAQMLLDDLDGDGVDELVLGFPGANDFHEPKEPSLGQVVIIDKDLSGGTKINTIERIAVLVVGRKQQSDPTKGIFLGHSLAAGDLDGDGARELAMGAPMRDGGKGAVYLVFGHTMLASTGAEIRIERSTDPYQGIVGQTPHTYLGYAVAMADFNGDGVSDIALSAPGPGEDNQGRGRVFLLDGAAAEFGINESSVDDITTRAGVITFELSETFAGGVSGLGVALTSGDLDGDGFPDLVIGSQAAAETANEPHGAAFVYFGGSHFSAEDAPRTIRVDDATTWEPGELAAIESSSADDRGLGGALAVTDLDRDGAGDLALALGRRGSRVAPHGFYVISGSRFQTFRQSGGDTPFLENALRVVSSHDGVDGALFGTTLFGADVNGDHILDLAVSAPQDTGDSTTVPPGAVYFMLGTPLADYGASHSESYVIEELVSGSAAAALPIIAVVGPASEEHYGLAVGMSSHRSKVIFDGPNAPHPPNPFTYIVGRGPDSNRTQDVATHTATLHVLRLNALLPCGYAPNCPERE